MLHLRRRYPLWGKRKLWKVLCRDQGLLLSISTVGRILARLVRLKRVKPKRRRQFKHHARQPGELMQIDPMSVGLPAGFGIKEFKAACPAAGFVALKAYSRATNRNAKDFLTTLSNKRRSKSARYRSMAAVSFGMSLSKPMQPL